MKGRRIPPASTAGRARSLCCVACSRVWTCAPRSEDGLGQEIGEECGERCGRVERLHIDERGRQVFIKFTDAVSALRAVNALVGRVFNGNTVSPRFWDVDRFERGEYS